LTVRHLSPWLLLCFLAAGCPASSSDNGPSVAVGSGGRSGSGGKPATGPAGQSGGVTGGATSTGGASGGSPGDSGGASGGAAGTGGTSAPDAPEITPAGGGATSSGGVPGAGSTTGGTSGTAPDASAPIATDGGRPWLMLCGKDWTREQCCAHYCTCMMKNCTAQTPTDCVATCVATKTWKLDCRVEQCFETLNPKYPMDAKSHCGHAVEKPLKCQGLVP
jgi:hypothetical protein